MRTDEDVRFLKMAANLIGQTVRLHRLVMRDRERMLEDQRRLEKERESLAAQLRRPGSSPIVGESEALRVVMEKVQLVARSASPVLLRGESGTGKELFAQALHEGSPRRAGPFIKLNCAALPESVLESELFGHEKGVVHRRAGAAQGAVRAGRWRHPVPRRDRRDFAGRSRPSCCGCCRRASSSGSAARAR